MVDAGSHPWGKQVEDYARRLAGHLGVPDFVYELVEEHHGSRNREVSDGLLICGDEGLIIQSKARSPDVVARETPERRESWILKNALKAKGQADGTRDRLAEKRAVEFISLRGFRRTVSGIGEWPSVVILAHPNPPDALMLKHFHNTMWITLDDWHGLHDRLRSTAAVITYVRRALASGLHPALGHELGRYLRLANSDEHAPGPPTSVPYLPVDPIEGDDLMYASIINEWIEHVWPQDGPVRWRNPNDYRKIVEMIDRIPPVVRVRLGRKFFDTAEYSMANGRRKSFYVPSLQSGQYCIVCDDVGQWSEGAQFLRMLNCLTSIRHSEAVEHGLASGPTLGIGFLSENESPLSYSFVCIERPRPMPPEARWIVASTYGMVTENGIADVRKTRRNDHCPCGSGRKFKACHMHCTETR